MGFLSRSGQKGEEESGGGLDFFESRGGLSVDCKERRIESGKDEGNKKRGRKGDHSKGAATLGDKREEREEQKKIDGQLQTRLWAAVKHTDAF